MFCSKCLRDLPSDSKLCMDCGGKAVEDGARYCSNCFKEIPPDCELCVDCGGKAVEDGDTYCIECLRDLPSDSKVCMDCGGKAVDDGDKLRLIKCIKWKHVAIAVLITIVFLAFIEFLGALNKPDGYMRSTVWGMSVEEVYESEETSPELSSENGIVAYYIDDFEDIEGTGALLSYYFEDDLLMAAAISIASGDLDKTMEALTISMIDKYGNYTKIEPGRYSWEAKESVIELAHYSKGLITLTFVDRNYKTE